MPSSSNALPRAMRRWLFAAAPAAVVRSSLIAALAVGVLPLGAVASAQQNSAPAAPTVVDTALVRESFGAPPANLAKHVVAPRHLNTTLSENSASPNRSLFLIRQGDGMPTMAAFARPHVFLGGVQLDIAANRARTLSTRGSTSMEVLDWRTNRRTKVQLPAGATASSATWSPDGKAIAFLANFNDASFLYVADAASGRSRRVSTRPVLATLVTAPSWSADGSKLLTVLVPNGSRPPVPPAVPEGPKVRVSLGEKAQTRTYASLLETPYDMALLEHAATGQLALVDVARGSITTIGQPRMFRGIDLSPDGGFARVTLMEKPFSYYVPTTAFGTVDQLWAVDGRMVAELGKRAMRLGDAPQNDSAGADTTRRNLAWSPDGRGFVYLQLAPGADSADAAAATGDTARAGAAPRAGGAARRRDRLVQWLAPFGPGDTKVLFESEARMSNVAFSEDGRALFVTEGGGSGASHNYAVYLDTPAQKHTITRTRAATGSADARRAAADSAFFNDAGRLLTVSGKFGGNVALTSADTRFAYLQGVQYSPDALKNPPRPFVDRIEIRTGTKTRVFQSAPDVYETVAVPVDAEFQQVITMRESPTMVPDAYLRDIASGNLTKLTSNRDYSPEVTGLDRRTVQVTRADGKKFWVDVTLPANWNGEKAPALFWFYPREFTDQEGYDRTRRTVNQNRFPNVGPRSMEILALEGYAIVEPDAPIFGEAGRMNDNYVPDLRNNLSAVIDELERQGIIDRQRLAVGGHSYGAFSTVNAMVHTPFFKAGIAGDGNYNRSLTPNGFQSERRDLWEARDIYLQMSPFFHADRLTGSLLMYHGEDDQNVGTAPENSTRLFHALQGLGKTVSLYMYPYEDHGPATRETLLDMWSRWTEWLDIYVKNAPTAATPTRTMN